MRLFFIITTIFLTIISAPALAQTKQDYGILAISGNGEISATPDIAYINTGVITVEKTAKQALAKNSLIMNELINKLNAFNIAEKDIKTSNFSISPQYNYNNSANNQPPKIVNYRVSNMVTITVRNLNNLGKIIDATVSIGANSISSVSFSVANKEKLLDEARKKAMQNAINKAKLYANSANISLGKILVISENSGFMPPPPVDMVMARNMAIAAEAAPTPIQSGELTFRANVNVQWRIEQ